MCLHLSEPYPISPSSSYSHGSSINWRKRVQNPDGGQVSCRTGENLGFNVKNKQEQILASGNVSVCLSHSIKRPEKRPVHNFHFLSQPQMKCLVKLLVGNQWPMWCSQSDCINCNRPWFLAERVINCRAAQWETGEILMVVSWQS